MLVKVDKKKIKFKNNTETGHFLNLLAILYEFVTSNVMGVLIK